MKSVQNLSVGLKLAVTLSVMIAFQLLLTACGFWSLSKADHSIQTIGKDGVNGSILLANFDAKVLNYRMIHYRVLLAKTDAERNKLLDEMEKIGQDADKLTGQLATGLPESSQNLVKPAQTDWKDYRNLDQEFISAARANSSKRLAVVTPALRAIYTEHLGPTLEKLYSGNHKLMTDISSDAKNTMASVKSLMVFACILATTVGIALAYVITKVITTPIKLLVANFRKMSEGNLVQLRQSAEAMAAGDLTSRISPERLSVTWKPKDEIGVLCDTFNSMSSDLTETLEAVAIS